LRLIAEASLDNQRGLTLAAETAARVGLFEEAIQYRDQLAKMNPTDAVNLLELARIINARGQHSDAVTRLAQLATDQSTPNSIRAQATESMAEIVRVNKELGPVALQSLKTGRDDAMTLARAAVVEAMGRLDEASASLSRIRGPLEAVAQCKLGRIALASQRLGDTVGHFERAVYLDAAGSVSDSIAFSSSGTAPSLRGTLVLLYTSVGRDEAALRLAGADTSHVTDPGDPIRPIVTGVFEGQSRGQTAFEPSMTSLRRRDRGLGTVFELNQDATGRWMGVATALIESAMRLNQFDRARQLQKAGLGFVKTEEERATAQRRLGEITTKETDMKRRLASLLHLNLSRVSESIYIARGLQ
jgi:tetratricopeptide (TPR) repeat protein